MHKHNGIFMDDVNSSTISFYHVSKTKKRAKSANFSGINVPNVPKHKTTKLRCNNPIRNSPLTISCNLHYHVNSYFYQSLFQYHVDSCYINAPWCILQESINYSPFASIAQIICATFIFSDLSIFSFSIFSFKTEYENLFNSNS